MFSRHRKIKLLKSISDGNYHEAQSLNLKTTENQLIMQLNTQELVKIRLVALDSGSPGLHGYRITAKGLDYLDSIKDKRKDNRFKIILAIFSFALGCLSTYLAFIFHWH